MPQESSHDVAEVRFTSACGLCLSYPSILTTIEQATTSRQRNVRMVLRARPFDSTEIWKIRNEPGRFLPWRPKGARIQQDILHRPVIRNFRNRRERE